jgi:hypothetical protein
MNPSLGRNFEAMDPLEWLARLADHIPDPGKRRTHFYAHYANRVRGEPLSQELGCPEHEQEQPKKRRCSRSWARLIAKVFPADPLVCKRCRPLKVVAYIRAHEAILHHAALTRAQHELDANHGVEDVAGVVPRVDRGLPPDRGLLPHGSGADGREVEADRGQRLPLGQREDPVS